jgi:hypothetical protein
MAWIDENPASVNDCADPEYAEIIIDEIRAYAYQRARGYHYVVAFHRVFGCHYTDQQAYACGAALEGNAVYVREFERLLDEIPLDRLWSPRIATYELLNIVRSGAKESVAVTAIKELNVLFEITTVDESGRTTVGRRLSDFYANEAAAAKERVTQQQPVLPRHPEPGTPEAVALENDR